MPPTRSHALLASVICAKWRRESAAVCSYMSCLFSLNHGRITSCWLTLHMIPCYATCCPQDSWANRCSPTRGWTRTIPNVGTWISSMINHSVLIPDYSKTISCNKDNINKMMPSRIRNETIEFVEIHLTSQSDLVRRSVRAECSIMFPGAGPLDPCPRSLSLLSGRRFLLTDP